MERSAGKIHRVELTITRDGGGGYRFDPQSDLWDEHRQEFVFRKDAHAMHAHDYHLLEFALDDRTGEGLTFPPNPHNAIWVAEGHEEPGSRNCPDRHTQCNYDAMDPMGVSPEGDRLLVRNDNARKEHWVFTINVAKAGEDPANAERFISWDPGANNQNGGAR